MSQTDSIINAIRRNQWIALDSESIHFLSNPIGCIGFHRMFWILNPFCVALLYVLQLAIGAAKERADYTGIDFLICARQCEHTRSHMHMCEDMQGEHPRTDTHGDSAHTHTHIQCGVHRDIPSPCKRPEK